MKNLTSRSIEDEAALRSALAEAEILTTLLVTTHLSGDTSLLEKAAPHIDGAWDYMQSLPDELRAEIIDRLVQTLQHLDVTGDFPPREPPRALMQEMMTLATGQEVPEEYQPLVVEELGLAETDTRRLQWRTRPSEQRLEDHKVLVIGAGLSGICAAVRLQEAGIPYEIVEKNDDIGGTWLENDYPDCGVDTANHIYSYSFKPKADWSRYFSKRDEILNYILETVRDYGIRDHIRFGVEVESMAWDEASARWQSRLRHRDGRTSLHDSRFVITAVGILNRPAYPDIAGLDDFRGAKFHTAEWDHEVELAGKRVAMIGTGASGMQAGPAIAGKVRHLSIFQRSPHWAGYNPLYHKTVSEGQMWALANVPLFAEWQRFLMFWASSDGFHSTLKMDPDWPQPDISLNRENHAMREMLVNYIKEQLNGDEELIRKCVPSYPPYGKRMLRDNNWYKTVLRGNVDLIDTAISRVVPEGVETSDGVTHAADVLILATGFNATRVLWPLEVAGRGERQLSDQWAGEDPRAYLGIAAPNFPNLFMTLGPNTGLAHGGSAIFHIECQVKYILQAMRETIERDQASVEVRQDVHDRYNDRVDEACKNMVWSHPGVNSWYKNDKNRVTITSPWRLVDYWALTRRFDPAEYTFTPRKSPEQSQLVSAERSSSDD
ncbi:probable monooxygenase [Pseudooceanicola batsensis HTCC2597]|uniref:Probable monooxygenase n=1 Tax=Pseudooceanicola batsensis (strain ATCC BAA-863 / DSM 15984 / KCTC 12145 / HTCC2597) TaxID=252305 RepID=A3U135_PSEBH|nr:NAD(P)/FAD-dependent oxidoreductase [Pseudooceanicola batsensis]EAQ02018.1 probable monooxygenase [Pseudooceanicola batsensis HTCC2597]